MLKKIILVVCIWTETLFQLQAQNIEASLPIKLWLQQNKVNAYANTTFDIGGFPEMFDNNTSSLARTPSVNPLIVTLAFDTTYLFTQSWIMQGAGNGWWTMEAADSLNHFTTHSGSYTLLFSQKNTATDKWSYETFTPVSRKILRLTLKRTTGDNYVHLREWRIFASVPTPSWDSLKLFPKPSADIYINDSSKFNLVGYTGNGHWYLANQVIWNVSDTSLAKINTLGWVKGFKKGWIWIKAQHNSFSDSVKAKVTNNPSGHDLGIPYIRRLPVMNYVLNTPYPDSLGWPSTGQIVTWRAKVKNWKNDSVKQIPYLWKKNGITAQSGIINLPPSGYANVDLQLPWSFKRDTLSFMIDTDSLHAELEESNNTLEIFTDAISLNIYVEESVYTYFRKHQARLKVNTLSFDDWAQMQVRFWHDRFAKAIYDASPNGVLDRIRIDSIAIVPDGALPLYGGHPVGSPNVNDSTVDIQYGFPAYLVTGGYYDDTTSVHHYNPFYFDWQFVKDVLSYRYLFSLTLASVYESIPGTVVQIKEHGQWLGGSPWMPFIKTYLLYSNSFSGIMNDDPRYMDEYSTAALNLIHHHRAVAGNNCYSLNWAIFKNDLPNNHVFRLSDHNGFALAGAAVEIFTSVVGSVPGSKFFDSIPEFQTTADAQGRVFLGKCPFSANSIINSFPSEIMLLFKVTFQNKTRYAFFESLRSNLEYWKGNTDTARFNLIFNMMPLGIEKNDLYTTPQIFPNPAQDNIWIELPDEHPASLSLYSTVGVKILEYQNIRLSPTPFLLSIKGLPKGIYILNISLYNKNYTAKIVKE